MNMNDVQNIGIRNNDSGNVQNAMQMLCELKRCDPNAYKEILKAVEAEIKGSKDKLNVLVVGAEGVGKSSTVNALIGEQAAKINTIGGTQSAEMLSFEYGRLVFWDCPGYDIGGSVDHNVTKLLMDKLTEDGDEGNMLIDIVLVIMDGSTRDHSSSYRLIQQIILPMLGDTYHDRLLVALNQCDMALKGRHWNQAENIPDDVLKDHLEKTVQIISGKLNKDMGIDVKPVYYSAGYFDGNTDPEPFNIHVLTDYILSNIPDEKRKKSKNSCASTDKMRILRNAEKGEYDLNKSELTLIDLISDRIEEGKCVGENYGEAFGTAGEVVCGAFGGVIGAAGCLLECVGDMIGGMIDEM
ncbi:MAG: 50S ribosome-binding GTPase [Oscillospiraceae bacterium]|nr:50S ribosome-binding GTPase [Oscillospiraceae bacterium]MDY6207914.1 GTPase [Oscillospiraceae bacterium]